MSELPVAALPDSYSITASLYYPQNAKSIYNALSIDLPKGKITCLLGESGCGKSSLLKQIAGLTTSSSIATLTIKDTQSPEKKATFDNQIAYMAQQDLLMPWLSVLDNVLLHFDLTRPFLAKKSCKSKEIEERALTLLSELGLADAVSYYPNQLSGGMRQRVALARTLMQDKSIVLMDEPFSALDAVNRYKMQSLAAEKLKGKSVLFVTHDAQEALRIGEKIVLFPKKINVSSLQSKPLKTKLFTFPISNTPIPRMINAQFGEYQSDLLAMMER